MNIFVGVLILLILCGCLFLICYSLFIDLITCANYKNEIEYLKKAVTIKDYQISILEKQKELLSESLEKSKICDKTTPNSKS